VVNLVQTDASGNPNYETASTMAEVELTLNSPDDYAWTAFVLPDPQPVIANDEYAIVLSHEKGSLSRQPDRVTPTQGVKL